MWIAVAGLSWLKRCSMHLGRDNLTRLGDYEAIEMAAVASLERKCGKIGEHV